MAIGRLRPYVVVWKTRDGLAAYHGLMRPLDYRVLGTKTDGRIVAMPVEPDTSGAAQFLKQLKRDYGITLAADPQDAPRRKYVFVWREMMGFPDTQTDIVRMWQVSLTDRELRDTAEALLATRNIVDVVAVPHDEVPMGEEEFYETVRREYGLEYKAELGPKDWIPGRR